MPMPPKMKTHRIPHGERRFLLLFAQGNPQTMGNLINRQFTVVHVYRQKIPVDRMHNKCCDYMRDNNIPEGQGIFMLLGEQKNMIMWF